LPPPRAVVVPKDPAAKATQLYIHAPRGRRGRQIDEATESFVDATRMGAASG
jgi:hypothetical protein